MEINPDAQNIDRVFSSNTYYIDFYQREYKWGEEPVARLLNDILYAFETTYSENSRIEPGPEVVAGKYPWYYLNTYVTNTVDGRVFIVDGQQRLTTLTLILIKLYHLTDDRKSALADWVRTKIAGQDGFKKRFWMNHEPHIATLQALFENAADVPVKSGVTAVNMLENFRTISRTLNERLSDKRKLETFVFYFLHRLVLINLSVAQTDVPMVFEVINDRGVRLRPYEILKGKLIGQIDKVELETTDYNAMWDRSVGNVNRFGVDEIDTFFVYFLKAKFASSRGTGERFDKDYHREMFKPDLTSVLKLEHNADGVKAFISLALRYFTALYARVQQATLSASSAFEHAFYNRLNGMDNQNLLIMSACVVDDPEEEKKIRLIAFHLDRMFSLARLQRAYDSNEFNDAIYRISNAIRDEPADAIAPAFEKALLELLGTRRDGKVDSPFDYAQFKNTSINDVPPRFTRYFFARIDAFLAANLNKPSYKVEDLVTKTGAVNGYHIEHIVSYNADNMALFGDARDQFEIDRNRLGAVLLLKGRDNISSGNEAYVQKLQSYAGTLYWNETLRADAYKSKLDFKDLIEKHELDFKHYDQFGPEEIESRQKLLFRIGSLIWATPTQLSLAN